jgi:predicted restriction endonuclease
MPRNWTEQELLIAMNLYCILPFGRFNKTNKLIIKVAEKLGRSPSSLAMKLSNLASLDPYHQQRGIVGLKSASNLDRRIWAVFQENWSEMAEKSEAAFEYLMSGETVQVVEDRVENQIPEGSTETERTIKTRRLQQFFRKVILTTYENRCALTGIAIPEILVASHIIPWSENEERRADPTNGLCLNALHDKAFDRHLITFDEDYRLVVSSELKKGNIPEFQVTNFTNLEGTALKLPLRFLPDPQALQMHRETFIA